MLGTGNVTKNRGGGEKKEWVNFKNTLLTYFKSKYDRSDGFLPPHFSDITKGIENIITKYWGCVEIDVPDGKIDTDKIVVDNFIKAVGATELKINDIIQVKSRGIDKNGNVIISIYVDTYKTFEKCYDNILDKYKKKYEKYFDFKVFYIDKGGKELSIDAKQAYLNYINKEYKKSDACFTSEATLKDYFFKGFFTLDNRYLLNTSNCQLNYTYNKDIAEEIDKTDVKVKYENGKIVIILAYYLKHDVCKFNISSEEGHVLVDTSNKLYQPSYNRYYVFDSVFINNALKKTFGGSFSKIEIDDKNNLIKIFSKYTGFTKDDIKYYNNELKNADDVYSILECDYEDFLKGLENGRMEIGGKNVDVKEILDKSINAMLDYVNKEKLVKLKYYGYKKNTCGFARSRKYIEYYIKACCEKYVHEELMGDDFNRNLLLNIKSLKGKPQDINMNNLLSDDIFVNFARNIESSIKCSNELLRANWDIIKKFITLKNDDFDEFKDMKDIKDCFDFENLVAKTLNDKLVYFFIKFDEVPKGKKLKTEYENLSPDQVFSVLLPAKNTFGDEIFVKYFNKSSEDGTNIAYIVIESICNGKNESVWFNYPEEGETYILKFNSNVYEDINKNNNATPVDNKPKIEPKLNIELNPKIELKPEIEQKLEMKPIPKLKEFKLNNDTKVTKCTAKLDTSKINEIGEIKKPVVITDIKNNTLDTTRPLFKIAKETLITKTPGGSSTDIKKSEVINEIKNIEKNKGVVGSKDGRGTKKTKGGKDKTSSIPNRIDDKKPCCCNKCCCKCCQTRG